jgi:hypothetical protein
VEVFVSVESFEESKNAERLKLITYARESLAVA